MSHHGESPPEVLESAKGQMVLRGWTQDIAILLIPSHHPAISVLPDITASCPSFSFLSAASTATVLSPGLGASLWPWLANSFLGVQFWPSMGGSEA